MDETNNEPLDVCAVMKRQLLYLEKYSKSDVKAEETSAVMLEIAKFLLVNERQVSK